MEDLRNFACLHPGVANVSVITFNCWTDRILNQGINLRKVLGFELFCCLNDLVSI